ncbi:MAG: repair protein and transcriptional regulator, AraC family, partial [Solirubrobacterales bacterium]|nr:repair protein and transcriptional regulator, AraC family [Solirubrobacterales bacterium]
HLLDLDADPAVIDPHLAADPLLAPLVARRPGLRKPGHVDPTELVTRAILGQQVSVAGARTLATRLAAAHGTPLPEPDGTLTHLFPDAATIAELPDSTFAMPRARSAALARTCAALADGTLDLRPGADRDAAREGLLALKGIGPWTAGYVAMRALGDPDAWLPTDVGVRNGLARLGAEPERAERWRPWRSYALMHLWAGLGD